MPFKESSRCTNLAATRTILQDCRITHVSVPSASVQRRRRLPFLLVVLCVLMIGGIVGLWLAPANETAMPDQLDLGIVSLNSRIELNARLLTSTNSTPIEIAHQKIDQRLPAALRPYWKHLDPHQLRGTNQQIDVTTISPKISAPSHFRISKSKLHQNPNWYNNNPYLEIDIQLDTSRTGSFQGEVVGRVLRRRAAFPVRYTVQDRSQLPRALVISPFSGDSTAHGSDFNSVISALSSAPLRIDYLRELPPVLEDYSLVLLADSPLINHTAQHREQLRAIMNRGGRVILACNAFFRGTVGSASGLLEPFDFGVVDEESQGKVDCSNIIPDPLTENVKLIQMFRASPINVDAATAGGKVKPLVYGADGHCYAAVARPDSGGELVVLTQSLWWHWVHQYADTSDNVIFLRNLLSIPPKSGG